MYRNIRKGSKRIIRKVSNERNEKPQKVFNKY